MTTWLPRERRLFYYNLEAHVPKLIIEFADPEVFLRAVKTNDGVVRLEKALANVVADETAHEEDEELIRFDPNRQVDIVLYVAAMTLPTYEYIPKMYLRSASKALCTLESYDFGDMVARKTRIGRRVKELLGVPSTDNIQMTLNLLPEGHWERI